MGKPKWIPVAMALGCVMMSSSRPFTAAGVTSIAAAALPPAGSVAAIAFCSDASLTVVVMNTFSRVKYFL